jgi:alpha/beta superfamily hydrolase
MNPFRFHGESGALFGVLHAADPAARAGRAVLLCNPFGQEAVRSQRVFRVLADRFARTGCATLRFDYFGTGDSDGDDGDASLDTWCTDVLRADAALRERTGATRTCWLGLRLGATLAALASARALAPPERLILWDPIVDGRAWLGDIWTMRNLPIIAGLCDIGRHDLAAELNWSTLRSFNTNYTEYVTPSTGSGEGLINRGPGGR